MNIYSKLHDLQVELVCYSNDWHKLDFIRRFLVVVNGYVMDWIR